MRHGAYAAYEIAEIVRQIDVVALVESIPRKIAITPKDNFLCQVQTQGIDAMPVRGLDWIDRRAERFAHLLAAERHEAVSEHLPGNRQLRAHQHRRPDDGVKARDVFADQM